MLPWPRDSRGSEFSALKFLMEGNVYREVLSARGIEAVIPNANDRERINAFIFEELVKGIFKNSTKEYFQESGIGISEPRL